MTLSALMIYGMIRMHLKSLTSLTVFTYITIWNISKRNAHLGTLYTKCQFLRKEKEEETHWKDIIQSPKKALLFCKQAIKVNTVGVLVTPHQVQPLVIQYQYWLCLLLLWRVSNGTCFLTRSSIRVLTSRKIQLQLHLCDVRPDFVWGP